MSAGLTHTRSPVLPAGWQAHVAAWSAHLAERGTAAATIECYARHLGWLAGDHPHAADPWTLTPQHITTWLDQQNWSTGTRRKVLGSLRSFYTWAIHHGHAARSPLAGVSALPRRHRQPGPRRLPMPPRWREPACEWSEHLRAADRQPGTITLRLNWLRYLAETYADPWSLTPADLALFLSREDWQTETKRAALTTVRVFYAWAERAGYVHVSPARDLAPIRARRTLPRPTPDEAMHTALTRADARTRLALLLGLLAGLRRAEIAGIHTRDIGPATLTVHGKGGHQRSVPLHPDLAAALRAELAYRRTQAERLDWPGTTPEAEGWLFPSTTAREHLSPTRLGKLLAEALPAGWTAHSLRHRFATQAYAAVRDLRAVQELLGHTNPQTTARYAAVPPDALTLAVHGVSVSVGAPFSGTASVAAL